MSIEERFSKSTGGAWSAEWSFQKIYLVAEQAPTPGHKVHSRSVGSYDLGRFRNHLVAWFKSPFVTDPEYCPPAGAALLSREFTPSALAGGPVPTPLYRRARELVNQIGPDWEVIGDNGNRCGEIFLNGDLIGGVGFADGSRCRDNIVYFDNLISDLASLVEELGPCQTYQHPGGWLCDWENTTFTDRDELIASVVPHDPTRHEIVFHDGDMNNLRRVNLGKTDTGHRLNVVVPRVVGEALEAEAVLKGVPLESVLRERLAP